MSQTNQEIQVKDKNYIFTVSEDQDGIRVEFNTMTPEGQETEPNMTMVDVSLVVLSLTKMLRDEGMTDEQLQEFFGNIVENSKNPGITGESKEP